LTPSLALLLAACTATETPSAPAADDSTSPFADCAALTLPLAASPADSGVSGSPAVAPGAASDVPGAASGVPRSAPGASAAPEASAAATAAVAGATAASGAPAVASARVAVAGESAADLPDLSLPCFAGDGQVRLTGLRGPAVINLWGSWCGPCREELPVMQELADATAGRLRVVGVDTMDSRDAGASFAADKGISFPTLFDPDKKLLTALGKVNLPVTVFIGTDGGRFVYTGKALDKPTLGGLVREHTGVTVTG
jgi:cytochrome c biogenesis protein CcmG/thiol:disulfide interchange protein DsbE